MSHSLRRVPLDQSSRRRRTRWSRLAPLAALGLALATSACGMNVQTTNPYTPAIGVNFDAGDVQIRDLMILSRTKGQGFLSATLTANAQDSLVGVTGSAYKADGSDGSPLTVALTTPVAVKPPLPVVLTKRPLITVTSADIQAGLTAKMVLRFEKAGEVTTNAPVVDATLPQYATISPTPGASPSS
ncbi:MAG TPA: hypothetical protein VEQ66_00895 [Propionibacteriaceae bacterium]|nr:hypothetical protein [Propionibacteriaceae bacterium]